MSTTNTDGEGGAPYEGADLTLVGLWEERRGLDLFTRAWQRAINQRLDAGEDIPQVAVGFQPTHIWRRDGAYWKAARIFAADRQGNIGILFVAIDETETIRFMVRDTDGVLAPVLSSTAEVPPEEDLKLAGLLSNMVIAGGRVGEMSYVRLWNGRIYDSLEMMAKLRQLSASGAVSFDGLLVIEDKPLLLPAEAVGPDAGKVFDPKTSEEIIQNETPSAHYIATIRYPDERWDDFVPEIKKMVKDMVADIPRDGKGNPTIYISFDLEKRRLINQAELFRAAIAMLYRHYGKFKILVNGMTGPHGGGGNGFFADIHAEERRLLADVIVDHPDLEIVDMFGWSLHDKARAVATADLYIAPSGNATLIPMALDLPGVFFAAPEAMRNLGVFRYMSENSILIEQEFITSSNEDLAMRKRPFGHDDGTRISYSIAQDGFTAAVAAALTLAAGTHP